MIFDYETLKLLWWGLVGLLLVAFAVTDGYDMGVGALLPFLGRTDGERRVIINAIGATWEGNQTWLITAIAAIFAAWPLAYGAAFSGFYIVLVLALFALFLRPVGFEYRSKVEDPRWRAAWDWGLCIGGAVPAFVFGVAFGNLLLGVPFSFDETMRFTYTGALWQLLHPFALLCGIVSLAMLVMHGAFLLQLRAQGLVVLRAEKAARTAVLVLLVCFAAAGWWVSSEIEGYRIVTMPPPETATTPLQKTVDRAPGAWLDNYSHLPGAWLAPVAALAAPLAALLLAWLGAPMLAFLASAIAVTGVVLTAGVSMFPFIMPSSSHPNSSLTAWDAVSSHRTLQIMFWVVVIFLPVVVAYTAWVYRVMRGKVSLKTVMDNPHQMF